MADIVRGDIAAGLDRLGLGKRSAVIVHSSLSSFGRVDGGAEAVCEALLEVCGSVLMPAATSDHTGIDPPPGLRRPLNAYEPCATWELFDEQLASATQYSPELPIDRELGRIPETLRLTQPHHRSTHPTFSYVAAGAEAERLISAQRLARPLGPINELGELDGTVLLLGVSHTANTTIHLAEQQLGRGRFHRYAKADASTWLELPNIPGASHRFDDIEPVLRPDTRETFIGTCRARAIPVRSVLAATRDLIQADPRALLCADDPTCRCAAAYEQRLRAREER
ncbi:AAC(3) family N-acetyltransferase [Kribbella catacumbae]|uniref:AAC(3) family N-acetyltransferase n=1 Tax=Kribbella catacumbae TaxID=460086 RepID=UPI00037E77E3|nr:AAC(3) family N-acetyltransferase [Kribbella catacumbae]